MASVFKRSCDRKRPGAPWLITYRNFRYKGDDGIRVTVKGCPDKAATQRQAHALETEAANRRRGLTDPKAEAIASHEARPLGEHLDAYHDYLVAKGGTAAHADVIAKFAAAFCVRRASRTRPRSPASPRKRRSQPPTPRPPRRHLVARGGLLLGDASHSVGSPSANRAASRS